MTDLVHLQAKLTATEERAATLLAELNEIDRELGSLTPADPRRSELKGKRADVLSRYQGVKSTVKDLRRKINSAPGPKPQPVEVDALVVDDEPDDRVIGAVRSVLLRLVDEYRHHLDSACTSVAVHLRPDDVETIEDFLDFTDPEEP